MQELTVDDTKKIYGYTAHPLADDLRCQFIDKPPVGIFEAEFMYRAWGKSSNLLLYFFTRDFRKHCDEEEMGTWFRLSVWFRDGYKPRAGGPSMRTTPLDQLYRLTTKSTKNGNVTLLGAEQLTVEGTWDWSQPFFPIPQEDAVNS